MLSCPCVLCMYVNGYDVCTVKAQIPFPSNGMTWSKTAVSQGCKVLTSMIDSGTDSFQLDSSV